jgi:inosine/xanthosine triphosphate pyrophosphatase family protein
MTSPQDLTDRLEKAQTLLLSASIASCECMTKTPEAAFHAPTCRYGKLQFALEEIEECLVALRSASAREVETIERCAVIADDYYLEMLRAKGDPSRYGARARAASDIKQRILALAPPASPSTLAEPEAEGA